MRPVLLSERTRRRVVKGGKPPPGLGGVNMGLAATGNPAVLVTGPGTFFFYALVRTPICL